MSLIIPANTLASGGYDVDNSLRFNKGSSDNLTRTPSSQSDLQKSTFSFWLKRSTLGEQLIFSTGSPDTSGSLFEIYFDGGDSIHVETASPSLVTNRKFRDVSAWYHIVVAVDTTQGTDTNRVKIYVNGVQETSFSLEQYPSQNANLNFNKTNVHYIGVLDPTYGTYFDGYMAEVVEIDGQQLDPTSFGEFDEDSGIWKPIDVSGLTFGTNGFYLDFEDSSALGNDVSGNNNDFTANNLTAIDQSTDTCTNNFATLNPLATGSLITLSEGNLKATGNNASDSSTTTATIGITSGKFYWEAKIVNVVSGYPYLGIYEDFDSLVQGNLQGQANGTRVMTVYVVGGGTTLFKPGTDLSITAPANDNIIMFAVDKDNNKFYMGVNGSWYNSGDPTSGATGTGSLADLDANGVVMFGSHNYNNSATELNFGSPSFAISSGNTDADGYGNFEYAVPSGYYALCTKNLGAYGG